MHKRFRVWGVLALLAASVGEAQLLRPQGYQGPIPVGRVDGVREVGPLWALAVDRSESGEQNVWLAGTRVLSLSKGVWQARDLATGKLVWQAADAGRVMATTDSGVLLTQKRVLTRRRASDGQVQWRVTLPTEVRDIKVQAGTLYVTTLAGMMAPNDAPGVMALDGATGKTRWQAQELEMTEFSGAVQGVAFWNAYRGEPHFPGVHAFDNATGKPLYRFGATVGPLVVGDAQVLVKDFGAPGPDDRAQLQWVDLRSGKVRRQLNLAADFQCPGGNMIQHTGNEAFYAAPFVYVLDQCGQRLRQFEATGRAAGETPQKPVRTFAAPDDGRCRLGPVGEYLLFESRAGELRLIPTTGRSPVSLNGVTMPTGTGLVIPGGGQVSRLDAWGNKVYVGRVGGSLLAYDVGTKKARYQVRLPWAGFGPTLHGGNYAVFTAPDGLAVVREP
ncbi:PQQ-binding-like beta-propeller repeat protein [Deinococcus planocerae]|uniref:outer membrane protein assembly factor BamB family protein n=1 Tax=Deinococcus planocerae TaxID=1737569 RepID=UPI000C7F76BF|nr:PQQ-binding-like beta-propeller repeat protein [Deinococcus planocerae]